MVRQTLEHRKEALGEVGAGELLPHLGPVALGNAGDQRLLGREVAVEVARAHPGFDADLVHRGLVEPGPDEAALRRRQDLGAAIGLQLDIGSAHFTCAVR